MTDAVRVGRLLARVLVLLGGVVAATVVGWIAGEVTARADIPVIEEVPERIAPMTAVEIDPPESVAPVLSGDPLFAAPSPSLPASAVPSLARKSKSAASLVEREVLSVKSLDGTAEYMVSVVTAADEAARHAVFTLGASVLQQPSEVSRDLVGATASAAGPPVSNSVITSSAPYFPGAVGGRTAHSAPCQDESPGEHSSPASRAHTSGHPRENRFRPWSPMSLCGTATILAAACGGDHVSGAVMPGRPARADRISLDYSDVGHQAALAVVLRPDVTPG
ncbi:hypothetical protein [Amycolatopsis sp. NPDC051071]|uniref:hypothetical protein n=1 Tax=Amycolatopsis sp. NPDC051071 TaxID=3154637 RepID=UPI003415BACC